MFGIDKDRLVANLNKRQMAACAYLADPCDCKYGKDGESSEETGCPEYRLAVVLVEAMTDEEYKALAKRAGVVLL